MSRAAERPPDSPPSRLFIIIKHKKRKKTVELSVMGACLDVADFGGSQRSRQTRTTQTGSERLCRNARAIWCAIPQMACVWCTLGVALAPRVRAWYLSCERDLSSHTGRAPPGVRSSVLIWDNLKG